MGSGAAASCGREDLEEDAEGGGDVMANPVVDVREDRRFVLLLEPLPT
jgi:hypothetical protein